MEKKNIKPIKSNDIKDYGPAPVIFNLNEMSENNDDYRVALWTGSYFQVVLMSIQPGDDIGVEMHADVDQLIKIEAGDGIVSMGNSKDDLYYVQPVSDDNTIIIPAGTWHNVANTGDIAMKLYSIYAPPEYAYGVKFQTKTEADNAEGSSHT